MHRFVDPADGEVYVGAYCGVDVAQQVYACFDQPDLKAPFQVSATAPPGWTVLGNGAASADGAPGRWRFAATPPLPTSLFVLVAGPLHTITGEHLGVPFALHCRSSLGEHLDRDASELFAITHACFDRYLELFDEPYPFDSYDQVFVPGLNWGAMETPGCITFRDELLFRSAVTETERQTRAAVIAHEMAHMWFGDLVTMRWWDDLWLSESFAEYMGFQVLTEATSFTGAWTSFAMKHKPWGYDADQRPSTHPVAPARADVGDTQTALSNFDGISYAKGASVLRQLVAWLGPDVFLRGVNDFLTRHRHDSATLDDLIEALTQASQRDVAAWAETWLQTTGVDTITVSRVDDGKAVVARPGSRPHRLSIGAYDRSAGDPARLEPRGRVEVEIVDEPTVVEIPPGDDATPLLLVNDCDVTYCKVRLDASSWRTVEQVLGALPDPLSRAVAWTAARDLVRDGELPPRTYLEMVERHLPHERDSAVVEGVLGFARHELADRYLAADARGMALVALGTLCRTLAQADTSADVRLLAVRTVIDCAATGDATALAAWLEAGEALGAPLDRELRWRTLLRLCVLGHAGRAQIDAELRGDASSTGQQSAARCRAALPDAEGKRAVWAELFGSHGDHPPADLSNRLFAASASGFWQPEQRDVLHEYVPRFFPMAVSLVRRRGPAIAGPLGHVAFPNYAVEPDTVMAIEQCLRNDAPPVVLRRVLIDRLDDLHRALRVRGGAIQPST
jgi:aminopeptidase N